MRRTNTPLALTAVMLLLHAAHDGQAIFKVFERDLWEALGIDGVIRLSCTFVQHLPD